MKATKSSGSMRPSDKPAMPGPGQKPPMPQPAEERRAEHQPPVDHAVFRQVEPCVEGRALEAGDQPQTEKHHADGAAEHEGEARIPRARDIQKALHAGGIEHAGEG